MTKRDDNGPAFGPKHRIIGAIILISLAVIFVPMILDEQQMPDKAGSVPDDISGRDTKIIVTPVEELGRKKPDATPPSARPSGVGGAADTQASPTDAAKERVTTTRPPADADKGGAAPATTDAIKRGWVVQLGTYYNLDNAHRVRDKLMTHGYAVDMQSVVLKRGKATRVRIGPFASKTEAISMQARIHKDLGMEGMVLAYP